jgi:hypothetical protein
MSQSNKNYQVVLSTVGAVGAIGPAGPDGLGIDEVNVVNGKLIVSYSDGTSLDAGPLNTDLIAYTAPDFTYDTNGVLTRIDYAGGAFKTISYNGNGSINIVQLVDGAITITKTFSYNPDGTLDAIVQT